MALSPQLARTYKFGCGRIPTCQGGTRWTLRIPDGFYLVGDSCDAVGDEKSEDDRLEFYDVILKAAEGVTHIAEVESDRKLSGYPSTSRGLLFVPCKDIGLYAGGAVKHAQYLATAEVYPDSKGTTEEDCINAQVEAICGALDFLLKKDGNLIPCKECE
ncbi:hypothetical protein ACHAWF_006914 [Thalassiosira exigua]